MLASSFGYLFLAMCVVILGLVVPDDQVRTPLWLFVFLALAASARYCWLHPKAPIRVSGWFRFAALAVGAALFFGVIDLFMKGKGSYSLYVDASIAVIGVAIAISGAIRCALLGKTENV